MTSGGLFAGTPYLAPGKPTILCGRHWPEADGDYGLRLADTTKRTIRRVLPPADADAVMFDVPIPISPWHFGPKLVIHQLLRIPGGRQFAVELSTDWRTTRTVLVDAATKREGPLPGIGQARMIAATGDGRRLLLLELGDSMVGDAYVLDLKDGTRRPVAKGVQEALWMQSPMESMQR